MNVLLLARYGRQGASSRLRFFQFLPYLQQHGIKCTVQPLFNDALLSGKYKTGNYAIAAVIGAYSRRVGQMIRRRRFDLVWIEKEALPWFPAWVEHALLGGVPYMLDYDDALFHNYDLHPSSWVRRLLGRRLDILMAGARLVVCGNEYLAQRAREAGASWVEVLPTVVDLDRYTPELAAGSGGDVPRIVWIGTPVTAHYLKLIHKSLLALGDRLKFKMRVIGAQPDLAGVDVEQANWSEETEVASLKTCQVGVMPLVDSHWERGKCGYKLIQYMACGLPVVASPVGVNPVIVRDRVNGFLANSDEEWTAALEILLRDTALRQKMGSEGRKQVGDAYCVQQVAPRLARLLRMAAGS
jgi:glycosyltransferase involved in cell wall biosynthesis